MMDTLKSRYLKIYDAKFFLEQDLETITPYLKSQGWLEANDHVTKLEIPGKGNMNLILRVIPHQAPSFIIKQARPWVEKYPQLEAPVERIKVEHTFYQQLAGHPGLTKYSPAVMGFDVANSILTLEDFGQSADCSFVYNKGSFFGRNELDAAIGYLNIINQLPVPKRYPSNLALRELNHQHIFYLPFIADNQFNLDEIQVGLQAFSQPCKKDKPLYLKIEQLGKSYLGSGDTLLHGDFYPGSLLQTQAGLKVIDPEFSYVGPVEWDIAVFIAHLLLSATPLKLIDSCLSNYEKPAYFDHDRFSGFVGVEVLRRLIGLAQLPLEMALQQKADLIEQSREWIKKGNIDILHT